MIRLQRHRLGALLPQGRRLPDAVWQRRHEVIVRLGLTSLAGLLLLCWAWGASQLAAVVVLAAVGGPLLLASRPALDRTARSAAATAGLMAASVALVHLWSGVTEAHFIFFVMVGAVSLYQSWVPFGIALVVVTLHHGLIGTLFPDVVFGHVVSGHLVSGHVVSGHVVSGHVVSGHVVSGHEAMHHPWVWAGIHAAFVLAASLAHLAAWRLNEDQVLTDPLTGLANRTLLEEAADRLLRAGEPASVVFIDLDGFKEVNDSRGHACGDAVLLEIAGRLRRSARPEDLVARLGGDEFAVLVAAGPETARVVGERMLTALALPVVLDVGTATVHGSLGLATATDQSFPTVASLLRDADLAMYLAKAQGGNRLVGYADGMAEAASRRAGLLQDLAGATAGGQLEVYYQPTIRLADGTVSGFEALVRWHHPQLGLVPPAEFIPLAEQSGAIAEIGRWVLRQALVQGAAWSAESGVPLRMAVNLSPRQLMDGDVTAEVAAVLRETGFPAAQLTLEVTEGVLVQDVDRVVAHLEQLRSLGIAIAIDDFGTGFSGLSYLHRLPADVLKIDRSFVSDLPDGGSSATLIASVIQLAGTLGLDVVAEGVETEEQRRALAALDCGHAQGYYFARPQPAEQCLLPELPGIPQCLGTPQRVAGPAPVG